MTEDKKPTKAAPKKVTSADVVKYLTKLQTSAISKNDRTSVTAVIRLITE